MNAPRQHPPIGRDLIATSALALYSFVVAVGFARVFSGWDFLIELTVIVVVGHGSSLLLRRAGVNGWIAVPGVLLLLLYTLLALRYSPTFSTALPSGATRELVDLEIGLVREQFRTAVAPVIYGTGWATLALFAMTITVVMADTFAFRAEARGEALVPGGVLFVFIAALGSDRLRITSAALLIGAGIIAVVALRAYHDRSRRVELTSGRSRSLVLPAAVASACAIALLAGVIGPRLPGAEADALYDTRGRDGSDATLLSPLVDIRARLTNRGNVELFRVNADAAAYWRVTTLPEFDGRRFLLPRRDLERIESDDVPTDVPASRQQIQVLSLSGRLVPAAADPIRASGFSGGERLGINQNRDTATLVSPQDIRPGDIFNVDSLRPQLTPEMLRAATASNPPDPIFTEFPDDLPDVVAETALAVTAGATSPYDQALALQNFFQGFEYSTEVQTGHGTNAIESFLQQRIGYCEQFSATFAVMARTLGIPARVAVGFTPGILNDDGWYSVLGKNAHAWPEVWFDGIGWVSFEPTPNRGEPGATSYTGLPPSQDESGQTGTGTGGGGGGEAVPTTPSTIVPPPTTAAASTTATTVPDGSGLVPDIGDIEGPTFGGELQDDASSSAADESGSIPWTVLLIAAAIALTLALPAFIRRWRRREVDRLDPDERVLSAWHRARRSAEQAGVRGSEAMTPSEWADATATELPVAARPMASLASVVDQVSFAPPGSYDLERAGAYGSTLRHDCELWAHQVGRIAQDRFSTRQRVRGYFLELS